MNIRLVTHFASSIILNGGILSSTLARLWSMAIILNDGLRHNAGRNEERSVKICGGFAVARALHRSSRRRGRPSAERRLLKSCQQSYRIISFQHRPSRPVALLDGKSLIDNRNNRPVRHLLSAASPARHLPAYCSASAIFIASSCRCCAEGEQYARTDRICQHRRGEIMRAEAAS